MVLKISVKNYSRIARALSTKAILLHARADEFYRSGDFSIAKENRDEADAHSALARNLRTQKGGN